MSQIEEGSVLFSRERNGRTRETASSVVRREAIVTNDEIFMFLCLPSLLLRCLVSSIVELLSVVAPELNGDTVNTTVMRTVTLMVA